MTEREDTIERIEKVLKLTHNKSITVTIPRLTAERAVSMLKEQEAVKPKIDAFGHPCCPKCKILVYETWEFCPHCGRKVKWA